MCLLCFGYNFFQFQDSILNARLFKCLFSQTSGVKSFHTTLIHRLAPVAWKENIFFSWKKRKKYSLRIQENKNKHVWDLNQIIIRNKIRGEDEYDSLKEGEDASAALSTPDVTTTEIENRVKNCYSTNRSTCSERREYFVLLIVRLWNEKENKMKSSRHEWNVEKIKFV